jgi:2-haloalkanoic acid dehalogenase type II
MPDLPLAICFDLDDTFWAVQPVLFRAEARMRAYLEAEHPALAAQIAPDDLLDARRALAADQPDRAHDMTWLRTEALRRLAVRHGHDAAIGDRAFEVFIEARHEVELFSDVPAALERLGARFRLATFSNGNACVRRIGIGDHFELSLNAESVGCAKPHPVVFETLARRLGVQPSQLLHVGDHPENDIAGAAAVGCRTAWVNRRGISWLPGFGAPPDLEVPDLEVLARQLCG